MNELSAKLPQSSDLGSTTAMGWVESTRLDEIDLAKLAFSSSNFTGHLALVVLGFSRDKDNHTNAFKDPQKTERHSIWPFRKDEPKPWCDSDFGHYWTGGRETGPGASGIGGPLLKVSQY